jgi:hypothetical protein
MLNSNKMLFLYFNLCLIVEFDSVSCSFIAISVLTYSDDYDKQYDDILNLSKNNKGILYCTSLIAFYCCLTFHNLQLNHTLYLKYRFKIKHFILDLINRPPQKKSIQFLNLDVYSYHLRTILIR